jgi:hypothetical protein
MVPKLNRRSTLATLSRSSGARTHRVAPKPFERNEPAEALLILLDVLKRKAPLWLQ